MPKKKDLINVKFIGDICYFDVHSKHGIFTALIDKEDFDRIKEYSWSITKNNKNSSYVRLESRIEGKLIRLHQFIIGKDKILNIDHKNRNPLDNRKENLRLATQKQNTRNCTTVGNKTGFRGVYRNNKKGKYRACISINNKTYHIPGNFNKPEEAALARDEFALKISGEFAILNFKKERG